MEKPFKPSNYNSVSPYLLVRDVPDALAFICGAFDAEEIRRMTDAEGSILHAEVRIDDSVLMVGFRPWPQLPVASTHVYLPNVDLAYARALELGATSLSPPRDLPYGDRSAGVQDVQGNYWWLGTHQGATTK